MLFSSKNTSCAKYPSVYDIHFNNIYWQQTDTSNGTFFLYAAYLDVRQSLRNLFRRQVGYMELIQTSGRLYAAYLDIRQVTWSLFRRQVDSHNLFRRYIGYTQLIQTSGRLYAAYLDVMQVIRSLFKRQVRSAMFIQTSGRFYAAC